MIKLVRTYSFKVFFFFYKSKITICTVYTVINIEVRVKLNKTKINKITRMGYEATAHYPYSLLQKYQTFALYRKMLTEIHIIININNNRLINSMKQNEDIV